MSTPGAVAVVTISDRVAGGARVDVTGPALVSVVRASGLDVRTTRAVPDDVDGIITLIHELATSHALMLLAGGTGVGPRDHTPEAVAATCDPMIPGLGEVIRAASREAVPTASLSRACAGICQRSIVVAVPGSPGGATDAWSAIGDVMEHALAQVRGDDHPG